MNIDINVVQYKNNKIKYAEEKGITTDLRVKVEEQKDFITSLSLDKDRLEQEKDMAASYKEWAEGERSRMMEKLTTMEAILTQIKGDYIGQTESLE